MPKSDTSLREQLDKILYPIYNYGWPDTGMPGTQKQMTSAEARDALLALYKETALAALPRTRDYVDPEYAGEIIDDIRAHINKQIGEV